MKRGWIGVGLLAVLLVLSLLAGRLTCRRQAPVVLGLEEAGGCALAGDWEGARRRAQEARDHGERCRPLSAALGNQGAMEEMDSLFARLEVFLRTEDPGTGALCAELARRAANLSRAAGWWDLL